MDWQPRLRSTAWRFQLDLTPALVLFHKPLSLYSGAISIASVRQAGWNRCIDRQRSVTTTVVMKDRGRRHSQPIFEDLHIFGRWMSTTKKDPIGTLVMIGRVAHEGCNCKGPIGIVRET